jgi:hypothetical protein
VGRDVDSLKEENGECSDSVKSASGRVSQRRAATASPQGPASTMSTLWIWTSSSSIVLLSLILE